MLQSPGESRGEVVAIAAKKVMRSPRSGFISGQISIDTLLAFVFGIIFVSAILIFAVTIINPNPLQIFVFKAILGLAGGGVAAVIPGKFEFRHLPFIRASGGIAVFAAIFFAPASFVAPVAQFKTPVESAEPVLQQWFSYVDRGDFNGAWSLMDPASRQWYHLSKADFEEVFENAYLPLGKANTRLVVSRGNTVNPPNMPPGIYKFVTYLTKFTNSRECVQEAVALRATEDVIWKVFSHQVSYVQIPCLDVEDKKVGQTTELGNGG